MPRPDASTWSDLEGLRARIESHEADSLEEAAQLFAAGLRASSPIVVLARVFLVLPADRLPSEDRRFASERAGHHPDLDGRTPVLTLMGTAGRQAAWCDRRTSVGHRAIPLLGAAFVQNIPMIAKILADLEVSFAKLEDGQTLDTRRLLGGRSGAFFVQDARSARDSAGRPIIPAKDFIETYDVRTVFGMGGAYADGTLAVAIVFTSELVDRAVVDRFSNLIASFVAGTAQLLKSGAHFPRPANGGA